MSKIYTYEAFEEYMLAMFPYIKSENVFFKNAIGQTIREATAHSARNNKRTFTLKECEFTSKENPRHHLKEIDEIMEELKAFETILPIPYIKHVWDTAFLIRIPKKIHNKKFHVSLQKLSSIDERLKYIEDNYGKLEPTYL